MRFRHALLALAALLPASGPAMAQTQPFAVEIQEVAQANAPAIHSAAFGETDGLWVFIGGRTNGLHLILGSGDAFPAVSANNNVVVYDPATDQRWNASLDELPADLAASLRATNMEHWQQGETLYVVGGYGRNTADSFVTFPTLTAVDLPGLVTAVRNGTPLAPHLRQTTSDALAVTGGHLVRMGTRYHLVGGHRFDGAYNFSVNPGQVYTNAIRSFDITDDGTTLAIANYSEEVDAANYHRRDGNVGPIVLPGGETGYAVYGGVFSPATLPYRQPLYFTPAGRTVSPFQAQFGHYTAPTLSLYDARDNSMRAVFFGGEGQFYANETTGAIQQDNLVPFIDDVSMLTRAADGTVSEALLPVRMPGLYGTNAHFFQNPALPVWPNGVVRLEALTIRTLVGYIHGGIVSATTNPGYSNGATEASRKVFAVYLTPDPLATEDGPSAASLVLGAAHPNPATGAATLTLSLARAEAVRVEAFDAVGRRVALLQDGPLAAGLHTLTLDAAGLAPGLYVVRAVGATGTASQRVSVAR